MVKVISAPVLAFVFVSALSLASFGASDEPEKETAPSFTLPDANQGLVRVKWPREKPVFLTFGEQASQTQIQAWSDRMKADYAGKVEFVGVAWLEAVPANLHTAAEAVIRTTRPEILIDKTGVCADRYACKPSGVNAFLIAPDGVILKRIHEEITEERYAAVQELVKPYLESDATSEKKQQEGGDNS